jgi:hypothetical protein
MDDVTIENAEITFRNFRGEEQRYNRKGDRNFAIVLNKEQYEELGALGWNVKTYVPKNSYDDEGNNVVLHLPVKLNFDSYRPPKVWMLTRNRTRKTELPEDLVGMFDRAYFINIDLTFRPYRWKREDGTSGYTAYLTSFYGEVHEDPLEEKYEGIDEHETYEKQLASMNEGE